MSEALKESQEPKPNNHGTKWETYPFCYEFTVCIEVESGEDSCYLAKDAEFNYKNALQAGLEEAETQISDMAGDDWVYSCTVDYTDESDEVRKYKEGVAREYFKKKGFTD
jgi:hypothetical protein